MWTLSKDRCNLVNRSQKFVTVNLIGYTVVDTVVRGASWLSQFKTESFWLKSYTMILIHMRFYFDWILKSETFLIPYEENEVF